MIAAILSLVKNGFGLGFNAWAKCVLSVMVVEALAEIVLINLIENWTSKAESQEIIDEEFSV